MISDHDLLIRLDTKVDQLTQDVKALGDGMAMKLKELEIRVDGIEKTHSEIKPEQAYQLLLSHDAWISQYKVTYKLVIALFTLFSLVLGVALGAQDFVKGLL